MIQHLSFSRVYLTKTYHNIEVANVSCLKRLLLFLSNNCFHQFKYLCEICLNQNKNKFRGESVANWTFHFFLLAQKLLLTTPTEVDL